MENYIVPNGRVIGREEKETKEKFQGIYLPEGGQARKNAIEKMGFHPFKLTAKYVNSEHDIKPGDILYYRPMARTEDIIIEGEPLVAINGGDILFVEKV